MALLPGVGAVGGSYGMPSNPSPLQGYYDNYSQGANQNKADYSRLMGQYNDVFNKTQGQGQYQETPDYREAINNLSGLARTGGYSQQDLTDLRARAISPIRAIYANAQRDIERKRALNGGYSPNYNAVTAKFAREQSDQISNQMQNANAGIAQNVAQNKLQVAPQFANIAQNQDQYRNDYGMKNLQQQLQALGGQTSLYGTTPALTATFGGQAQNASQLQAQIDQWGKQNGLNLVSQLVSGMKR